MKRAVKGVDVILAGDVCYEYLMAHRVLSWLRLCEQSGCQVFMGDPGRAYAPQDGVDVLAEMTVPTSLALEDELSARLRFCLCAHKKRRPAVMRVFWLITFKQFDRLILVDAAAVFLDTCRAQAMDAMIIHKACPRFKFFF